MRTSSYAMLAVAALVGALLGGAGCVTGRAPPPRQHDTISVLPTQCAGMQSCVLGLVTAAKTAAPVAEAAVFLVRELEAGEQEPVRFFGLTDEQGVFVIDEPPPGSYRISVYKEANHVELAGVELGEPGTHVLLVRLAIK